MIVTPINSAPILKYTQSNTSTQTVNIAYSADVPPTVHRRSANIPPTFCRRSTDGLLTVRRHSADVPPPYCRLATLVTPTKNLMFLVLEHSEHAAKLVSRRTDWTLNQDVGEESKIGYPWVQNALLQQNQAD